MSTILSNYLNGQWQQGTGDGIALVDPVLGHEVARVSSDGLDLKAGFAFARETGGRALRALTYRQRAAFLSEIAKVLQANRDAYYDIATANSGTTRKDTAVDVDGAIFTLAQFAKWGHALGDTHVLLDGEAAGLGKDESFSSQHVLRPTLGLALFINAFNFPSWGLWEKAAPALLSGVPVVVKPATATAWLTQRMVEDVVTAGVLPDGALSVVCGSSRGLLDALQAFDVLSFTGSAETAAVVRSHPAVTSKSVRVNIEADSLNSALLMPDAPPGSVAFDMLVSEVVREMTVKAGQKCTAIRRIFVPSAIYDSVGAAIASRLAKVTVGNPRSELVRMGSLVNREQLETVLAGLAALRTEAEVLFDGTQQPLVDADATIAACIAPTLLGIRNSSSASRVHAVEVFGPVATLLTYENLEQAYDLIRLGDGSLVASIYGEQHQGVAQAALALADSHGRVHALTPDVATLHTGHGNVMPHSLHGGPGRAGGGEELGGLRALKFYHRRSAIQASSQTLNELVPSATALPV